MRLALPGSAQRLALAPPQSAGRSHIAGREDRHTRRVALLKRVLPAIGLSLLLLVAIWPRLAPLWERMPIGLPAIDLSEAQELRMVNPRYSGIDREGRPFVVTAASGRQIPDRQDLLSLQAPRANIKTQGGTEITVRAISAIYQSQAHLIDLFGDVTVVHQNGTRFVTQSARVNAAENAAEGSDPVAGHGPSGKVRAQGFRILDKGDTVVFTGKAEMLLTSAKPRATQPAPPGLPAPVAALAVQAEAEPAAAPATRSARARRAASAAKAARTAATARPRAGRGGRKSR